MKRLRGTRLIYVHKERELADVEARYPAAHYVMVDDKLRILAAIKKLWGPRVTTVFVRQGHYARDPKILASYAASRRQHRAHWRFFGLPTRGLCSRPRQTSSRAAGRPAL